MKTATILKIARECGFEEISENEWAGYSNTLERFASAIEEAARKDEREKCAKVCEEVITHPAGHGGQLEGYGPVKTQRDGMSCAAAIR